MFADSHSSLDKFGSAVYGSMAHFEALLLQPADDHSLVAVDRQ